MDRGQIYIVLFMTLLFLVLEVNCNDKPSGRKDVIVVGGGLAGMAAARRLLQEGNINVKVLEARRDRYGGRIWTRRDAADHVRGVDVEIGAGLLNTRAKDNRLIQLAEAFELQMESSGSIHVHFVDPDGGKKVYYGDNATDLYTTAFKIVAKALNNVKNINIDRPVRDVLLEAVDSAYTSENKLTHEQSAIGQIVGSFPAAILHNFSSLYYRVENDFGWDRIVVDGTSALIDRIVAGSGTEAPIKLELDNIVRNIKVDPERNKVLIRTVDRKQFIADSVVIALPIGVLKDTSVIFEPLLPAVWRKAVEDLGIGYSSKVVVGFDEAFWPKNVGTFNVFSEHATDGCLQTWTNAYRLSGNPYLIGNIFGQEAKLWETKPEKLKELVNLVLGDLFGIEKVNAHIMTTFLHSNWSTDEFVLGSVSYPRVGNIPSLWQTLQKPVCPYMYFAGAYTETISHVDSLHGAYNSGVRAAEQIIKGVCKKTKHSKKNKKSPKQDETLAKEDKKPSKDKKDEL